MCVSLSTPVCNMLFRMVCLIIASLAVYGIVIKKLQNNSLVIKYETNSITACYMRGAWVLEVAQHQLIGHKVLAFTVLSEIL